MAALTTTNELRYFPVSITLKRKTKKLLLTSEIDTMRLHYASGYEDFTIFNTDFLFAS